MTSLEEFAAVRTPMPSVPKGWEPQVEVKGGRGHAVVQSTAGAKEHELLIGAGFDPLEYRISGDIAYRKWMRYDQEWLHWYKFDVERIVEETDAERRADIEACIKQFSSRPLKPKPVKTGNDTFVIDCSDWQIGKNTEHTITGVRHSFDQAEQRLRFLRSMGRALPTVALVTGGDLHEGCDGHYCVSVDTPVLTNDMRWVRAGDLRVGDGLYALNEQAPGGNGWRSFEKSSVTAHEIKRLPSVRVRFSNGDIMYCTPEHPFLAKPVREHGGSAPYRWVEARHLMDRRHQVAKVFETVWEDGLTRDHGWLAGLFDGEGHLSASSPGKAPITLGVSQLPGPVLDKVKSLLEKYGFDYTDVRNETSGVHTLRLRGGYAKVLELLGVLRPERLLGKIGEPCVKATSTPEVVAVEPCGDREIAVMSTSSRTYFADGYAVHNSQQTFVVDLDRRGQCKVVRRLLCEAVRRFSPLCERLVVTGVGGNHGENRKDGKSYTTFADNDDVAVLESIQEIFDERPGFEHVEFMIPDDELSVCVDLGGVLVAVAHGHMASRGGTLAQAKQQEWWKNQFWSDTPAAKAQILLTHHYHHLTVSVWGQRTHMQSPAYDGGSKWWGDMTGQNSPDGMLTFVVDPEHPLGWDDLKVL